MIEIKCLRLYAGEAPRRSTSSLDDAIFDVSAKQSFIHSLMAGRLSDADSHHVWVSVCVSGTCVYSPRVSLVQCVGGVCSFARPPFLPRREGVGGGASTWRHRGGALYRAALSVFVFLYIFVFVWRLLRLCL